LNQGQELDHAPSMYLAIPVVVVNQKESKI
jgi:hypothetical protein